MNELASLLPDGGFPRFACDAAWQSTLIGLLAALLLRVLKHSPAARAWIALLAMILCIVAPCATLAARTCGAGWLLPKQSAVAQEQILPSAIVLQRNSAHTSSVDTELADRHTDPADAAESPHRGRLSDAASGPPSPARTPPSWGNVAAWTWSLCALVWGASSMALAARLAVDLTAVQRLRRGARPCDDRTILAACTQSARHVGLRAAPPVAYSPHVSCPMVLAWGSPCILIPLVTPIPGRRGSTSRIDPAIFDRWLAVFCHELGHVRRRDGWSGLAAEAITVLLPWQPLIWLLRRELQRGCEEACDDWAVFGGIDPLDYAEALTEWIPRRSQVLALGIRNYRLPIRRRIERLLAAESVPPPQLSSRWIVGGASLAAVAALLLALLQTGMPRELAADDELVADGVAPHRDRQGRVMRLRPAASAVVLGDARLKHWNYVQALGFSADGESAFSAGRDGVVQTWNVSSGQSRSAFVRPHIAAAVSGDGRRLFLANEDGSIEVSQSMTGQAERTLRLKLPGARSYAISLLVASHDGSMVAAGGRYSTTTEQNEHFVAAWDARSERILMTVVGQPPEWTPGARVAQWQCLALSPDGERLAAGGLSHISCWSIRTAEQVLKLKGEGRIYALAFGRDGQQLASGDAVGNVRLWNTADGTPVLRLEHRSTISALAFSASGERLAAAAGDLVHLWDAQTGASKWSYEPAENWHRTRPSNGGLHFSGDGAKLSIGFGNRLVLLDAERGMELPVAGGAPAADFTALSAAGSPMLLTGDAAGRLVLWNAGDGRRARAWQGHAARIDAVAVSPAGDTIASTAIDGSLSLWDAEKAEPRHSVRSSLLAGSGEDDELAFSTDGQTLASVTRQRSLALWDVGSGRMREQLFWPPEDEGQKQPQAFPSAGRFLLAQWRSGAKAVLPQIGRIDRRRHGLLLAVSPDGRYAAGGVYGGRLEIWDIRAQRRTHAGGGHVGRLQSLVFSPDGSWLASAAEDGQVCFWRPRTGEPLASLSVGPPGGVVRKIAVGSDGRTLATLNGNGTVSIHRSPIEPLAGLAGGR